MQSGASPAVLEKKNVNETLWEASTWETGTETAHNAVTDGLKILTDNKQRCPWF